MYCTVQMECLNVDVVNLIDTFVGYRCPVCYMRIHIMDRDYIVFSDEFVFCDKACFDFALHPSSI